MTKSVPTDLTYRKDGLWVTFMPHTAGAEKAWAQIKPNAPFDRNKDGSPRVGECLSLQLPAILKALRKAGWTVRAKLLAHEQAASDAENADLLDDEAFLAECRALLA